MNKDLRMRLWNRFYDLLPKNDISYERPIVLPHTILEPVWRDYFKLNADAFNYGGLGAHLDWIKKEYNNLKWYEVYDFLEFIVSELRDEERENFISDCNTILETEISGYRFIEGLITDITNDLEIAALEEAFDSVDTVKVHMRSALRLYSNRPEPDYRNSVKESISAVEAMCNRITKSKLPLGEVLIMLDKNPQTTIPTPLKLAFEKIYAYTSSSQGIRHAMVDVQLVNQEEARFMLVACSAFVNYLRVKAQKAEIPL